MKIIFGYEKASLCKFFVTLQSINSLFLFKLNFLLLSNNISQR